jgi:uncharacterized protein (TIGR02246 family)
VLYPATPYAQQDIQQQILAAEKQWFDAFYKGDAEGVAKMKTEDFVFIQQGRITDKVEQTARNRTRGPVPQTRQTTVHRLFLHGDTAVLLGTEAVRQGDESARVHFTQVWVRRDGRWLIQHAHYSEAEN